MMHLAAGEMSIALDRDPYGLEELRTTAVFSEQRSIYFSVMCPRRLGGIQKLFEQAGGDVALNHAKNYTRDPHHLILLNGFSQPPQGAMSQPQMIINMAQMRTTTPPNQRASPVPSQGYQHRPIMVRGQQMMQAGRPTGPAGMQVMSGLRQQGPPNVTVQTPAGQGLMGGPQLWQGQQMGQQQGMTGIPQTSMPQSVGVPAENSVLRSQLNKPPMATNPQQNQVFLQQQQQQQQQQQPGMQQGEWVAVSSGRGDPIGSAVHELFVSAVPVWLVV
ncbi:Mediator of RNA polymerase II transcription subunit 25 [Amphibalanus amphitrite]|uniref:Mediator of RNA polymerase II transcription subunit 25 n=1 Tax=Amphibalanus amphitrite TaxID=1232801 RepID=A0A6A4W9R1_AMPAM|nr:Mediator of RNA polymerase II transcription subunit 25 [Amphibalanus amphitrite]